jgi:hypothetical protein
VAVIEWNYLANGTWGPKVGANGERTYQITIEAITNDGADPGVLVLSTTGFPRQYESQHPNDPFALCVEIDPKQDEDDAAYWVITYGYSTKIPQLAQANLSGGGGSPTESPSYDVDNPLARPPKVRWSDKMFKRTVFTDQDGVVIANKAGELFEPYQDEVPRLVLHVQRNLAEFDKDLIPQCVGGVNVSGILGYEPRQILCQKLEATIERDKLVTYYDASGEFVIAADDDLITGGPAGSWWYDVRINAGFHYWDPVTNKLKDITTPNGQRPSRPVLLNTAGTAAIYIRDGGVPNYCWFRVKRDAPFVSTGLFD